MARDAQKGAAQAQPTLDLSKISAEDLARALAQKSADERKKARTVTKAEQRATLALERGKVEAVGVSDEDDTLVQVDIRLGSKSDSPEWVTGAESKVPGTRYLFSADAVEFTAKGKRWRMSAVYAQEIR